MASLTGNQVGASYLGIIKTLDNTAITASPKQLSDGAGNALTVCASSSSLIFTGTADFSAATVTGITTTDTTYDLTTARVGGVCVNLNLTGSDASVDTVTLVPGSNVTILESAANVITIGSTDTDTTYDLASAQSGSDVNVNLTGSDATTDTVKFAAGTNITLTDNGSNQITIDASGGAAGLVAGTGANSLQNADSLVANPADAAGADSISLGNCSCARGNCSIAIGFNTQVFDAARINAIAIGNSARVAQCSIAIGPGTTGVSVGNVSIGFAARVDTGTGAIAIGCVSYANADGAVALGRGVCATRANYTTSCAFEACVAGQGIVVKSPDGLTTLGIGIDNSGNIVTYTP